MKTALVLGAGGFIGNHIVNRLKADGYWVRGVDVKYNEYQKTKADEFLIYDLRNSENVNAVVRLDFFEVNGNLTIAPFNYRGNPFTQKKPFDQVYQLAADMGGAGYINTGLVDADVMQNSAKINLNLVDAARENNIKNVFFSSSACVYNENNQKSTATPDCREHTAYPAMPDSEYGWEKLFSERLYLSYNRQYGMKNKIARFHNIFGEYGTWQGGKEKSPAAICRKIALCEDGGTIDVWGDGKQSRSFLHIDDCVDGIMRLMHSDFSGPVNIGSDNLITINDLISIVSKIANKKINVNYIKGPVGVRGRNSNNDLIHEKLNWKPKQELKKDLTKLYNWIYGEIYGK
jgi:GDP-D-mannose 3',5'-epimerase